MHNIIKDQSEITGSSVILLNISTKNETDKTSQMDFGQIGEISRLNATRKDTVCLNQWVPILNTVDTVLFGNIKMY